LKCKDLEKDMQEFEIILEKQEFIFGYPPLYDELK
jgi:hypothetical protein